MAEVARATPRSRFWRRFRRHRLAMVSAGFLALLSVVAIAAPVLAGYDPLQFNPTQTMRPPDWQHLLGTDQTGRDVLARVMYGSRVSLSVGIVSMSIAVAISIVLGSLAGYYGKMVDMVIMRVCDVMM